MFNFPVPPGRIRSVSARGFSLLKYRRTRKLSFSKKLCWFCHCDVQSKHLRLQSVHVGTSSRVCGNIPRPTDDSLVSVSEMIMVLAPLQQAQKSFPDQCSSSLDITCQTSNEEPIFVQKFSHHLTPFERRKIEDPEKRKGIEYNCSTVYIILCLYYTVYLYLFQKRIESSGRSRKQSWEG